MPVVTVLAVIVGGALTYFVQARLDERRAQPERERDEQAAARQRERDEEAAAREREREQQAEAAEERVIMRLLLDELDTLAFHHAMLAQERRYPMNRGPEAQRFFFPTEVWETYKPTLARRLTDSAWEAIIPVMHTAPRIRAIVLEAEPESPIESEMVAQLRNGAIHARDLYEALAGTPAPSVNEHGQPSQQMKREPFTPTAGDLRLLSEHLFYEVQMTFYLAWLLPTTMGTVLDPLARNAQIEAFTIHLRQLIDFLWGERSDRSGHDAFAADYFAPGEWARLRPDRPAILSTALQAKVGWGVVHLTYGRARSSLQDKQWDIVELARALAPTVICFADNVDPAKLDPQYLSLIKPMVAKYPFLPE